MKSISSNGFNQYKNALSNKGFDSKNSKGRKYCDPSHDPDINVFRHIDPFLADQIKITQSKPYRRLAYKTQVLCSPDNAHVRTRLIHTADVSALSILISETPGLNTNLCRAISAGHDIGHTPYGHLGEKFLSDVTEGNLDII